MSARDEAAADLRPARRDAALVTASLLAAVYFGSGRLEHFDPALAGYFVAVVVACFATSLRVSLFWRRPPSAFYGRALARAMRRPREALRLGATAGRDLAAQRFLARRGALRGLAHLLLSWGTLAGFAITLPLVFGWLRFEAGSDRVYRALFLSFPVARFDVDGLLGWLVFHVLSLAAVAVILGASYFLVLRLQLQRHHGALEAFHLAPLLSLLAVAITGLALPVAARAGGAWLPHAAAIAHEATVIVLLVALPYGKLLHVFIRPLHVGAHLVRARSGPAPCPACGAPMAPPAQLEAIESMLAARGFRFDGHQRSCAGCRRRSLATAQARLLGMEFQPRPAASLPSQRRAA